MRSVDFLKMAFGRWKSDFNPFLLISLEAFVIMIVSQLILVPLIIAVYFLFFFSAVFIDSMGGIIAVVIIVLIYLLIFAVGILIQAFINPGVVNGIEKQFGGEVVRFGDVFNYGKKVWKEYIGVVLLNLLVVLSFYVIIFGIFGGLIVLISMFAPLALCFGFVIFYPLALFISLIIMPVQYLMFIIRYKEDASSWECIKRSYSFVFRNIGFCLSLGLIVMVVMLVMSFIPFISIVISLFMMTFMHTAFLYVYYEMDV